MKTYIGDLEADGLLDTATQIWCGVFKSLDGKETIKFYPESHEDYIKAMYEFLDTVDCLIMHNGHGYDWPLMEKLHGYVYKGQQIDTVVWSRLFQPKRPVPFNCPIKNRPHSVETWGYRVGRGKPEHNDWTQYSEEMLHRCTEDTEIQLLIYKELYKESKAYNWDKATWLTGRLFEILGKQEQYGWLVDRPWMDRCIHQCTHWMNRIDQALAPRLPVLAICEETKVKGVYNYVKKPYKQDGTFNANMVKWLDGDSLPIGGMFSRVSFRPLDPNSRVEAIDYLLESGWEPKEWNINKETKERTSPKLSKDDPFEGVVGREGNLFAKRMQIKHRRSNVEGLIKHIRPDGRIPSVVTNLAETARLTHSKIVNIPNEEAFFGKWMRKIFIVEDGKVLVGTDADGCQNRIIGGMVGDEGYTNALLYGNKKDKSTVHFLNQKALAKVGYAVPYGNCKNLNFAHFFGGADPKLGKMVGGTKEDGEIIRKALLSVAPGLEDLLDSLRKEWRINAKRRQNRWGHLEYYDGWLPGLDGRPIFISSEHQILVYMVQSAEAILMTHAYVFLYDWLCEEFTWGEDFGFVIFYHDEVNIECKPEYAERIRYLSEQAIKVASEYLKLPVPQVGESKVGLNWQEIH